MEDDFTSLDSLATRKQKNVRFKEPFTSNSNLQNRTKYSMFKNLQNNPDIIKELVLLSVLSFLINHQTFSSLISNILPSVIRNFVVPENSSFVSSAIKAIVLAIVFYVLRLIFL